VIQYDGENLAEGDLAEGAGVHQGQVRLRWDAAGWGGAEQRLRSASSVMGELGGCACFALGAGSCRVG
jgi:hypothetical protein